MAIAVEDVGKVTQHEQRRREECEPVFFGRRKRFNGDVAALLIDFEIEVNDAPLGVLAVLDHAWLQKFNVHEATLLVAYSHATALYKQSHANAEQFVFSKLYPTQLDWIGERKVRAVVVEPMTKLLKERAYRSYDAVGVIPPVVHEEEIRAEGQARTAHQSAAPLPIAEKRPKPWLFDRATGQLTRRDSGRVFEKLAYYRDGSGYVVRDKQYPWVPDSDIDTFG